MIAPVVPVEPRSRFDYLVALVPLCSTVVTVLIAGYVAMVSRRQAKAANRKLNMDLYDKRFQIYMRAVDFFQALMSWGTTGNKDDVHGKFIRAKLESTFLFSERSKIRQTMDEMDIKATLIIGFWENAKPMAQADPEHYTKWFNDQQAAVFWFDEALKKLEKSMVKSMKFHEHSE